MSTPRAQPTARTLAGDALPAVHAVRVPSSLRCFALLLVSKVSLLTLGFGRTHRAITRLTRSRGAEGKGGTGLVHAIAERVAMAATFFPGRALCLEQSLVLHYLLRRRGIPSTLRLGVQAYPFAAHAWVEHVGEPVNENRETLRAYLPFPALPERLP